MTDISIKDDGIYVDGLFFAKATGNITIKELEAFSRINEKAKKIISDNARTMAKYNYMLPIPSNGIQLYGNSVVNGFAHITKNYDSWIEAVKEAPLKDHPTGTVTITVGDNGDNRVSSVSLDNVDNKKFIYFGASGFLNTLIAGEYTFDLADCANGISYSSYMYKAPDGLEFSEKKRLKHQTRENPNHTTFYVIETVGKFSYCIPDKLIEDKEFDSSLVAIPTRLLEDYHY